MKRGFTTYVGIAIVAVVMLFGLERACHRARPILARPDGRITDADRIAAMLSVHAHAYHGAGLLPRGLSVADLKFVSLETASDTLLRDDSPVAPSRRRRAIAKLRAYAAHTANLDERRRMEQAAGVLLAGHAIQRAARSAESGSPQIADEEASIYESINMPIPGCGPKSIVPATILWSGNGVTDMTTTVTVTRDPTWVAKRIDPQNWDACSPFFAPPEGTYVAGAGGTPVTGCTVSPADDPAVATPYPSGTPYKAPRFFEFYHASTGIDAIFKNILEVTTTAGAFWCVDPLASCSNPPYQVCYVLPSEEPSQPKRRLAACADGAPTELGEDDGHLTACPGPGSGETTITVAKALSFTNPFNTVAADAAYRITAAETTESVAELACCPDVLP